MSVLEKQGVARLWQYTNTNFAKKEQLNSLNEAIGNKLDSINYLGPVVKTGNPITYDKGTEGLGIAAITYFEPQQSGTGDPSPTNIRPITGYEELHIIRSGKNLFNGTIQNIGLGNVTGVGEAVSISDTRRGFYTFVAPGTYTISRTAINTDRFRVGCTMELPTSGMPVDSIRNFDSALSGTIIVPEGYKYIVVYLSNSSESITASNYQLEIGDIATSRENYRSNTYTAQIGQIVYGGEFDWTTGKLISKWAGYNFTGEETFSQQTINLTGASSFYIDRELLSLPKGKNATIKSSHLVSKTAGASGTTMNAISFNTTLANILFNINQTVCGTTIDTFKAYLSAQATAGTPLQMIYELATPVEIQLTATQISELENFNALRGDGNNIYAIFNVTKDIPLTLSKITGVLDIKKGGTGAKSAAAARAALAVLGTAGGTMTGELNLNTLGSTNAVYLTAQRVVGGVQYKARYYINGDTGAVSIQLRDNDSGTEMNKMTLGLTSTSFKKPVDIASGGTSLTSSPSMLVNLGSTSAAKIFTASPRPGITGTLAIGHGGTGATSKSGARTNLGITSGTSLPSSASAGDIFFLYN